MENFTTDGWGKHLRTNLRTPALLSKEFSKNIKGKNAEEIEEISFLEDRFSEINEYIESAEHLLNLFLKQGEISPTVIKKIKIS